MCIRDSSSIVYRNSLSPSPRWPCISTGERRPNKWKRYVQDSKHCVSFQRWRAGHIEKATVHRARWLTVIIRRDHCCLGTDMKISPVTILRDRRWFTASFKQFVFGTATETYKYRWCWLVSAWNMDSIRENVQRIALTSPRESRHAITSGEYIWYMERTSKTL